MAETLGRAEILRHRRDMSRVMRAARVFGPALSLRYSPAPDRSSRRIAFLLSRRVGSAVARNRLKRRLREVYRRHKDWVPAGCDYLLSATPAAAGLDLEALTESVRALAAGVRPAP
jgi:ribonuclease P protein component